MIDPVEHVWVDGKLVTAYDARIDLLTHSLHYGYGALEGVRSYRQDSGGVALFRLGNHMDRLIASAEALGVQVEHDREQLAAAAAEVVAANGLTDSYVRGLVFVGAPNIIFAHWLNPVHVALIPFAWSGYSDRDADKGTPAIIAPYPRIRAHAPLFRAKLTGHYMLNVLAYGHAKSSGVQQAIFLDDLGTVCEATGENVFVVKNGELSTPPADRSLLPGITRATVLELATELDLPATERDLTLEDLYDADEIFTTGTASGLLHIPELDGRRIGTGDNPVTRALRTLYQDAARGRHPARAAWLTAV
jgi:branched-chain amino acid aminotransferase